MPVYRVYFNRKREAPQVWSLDEGTQDSEVNVQKVIITHGCLCETDYNGAPANDDSPSACLLVSACGFRIGDGTAVFFGLGG